MTCPDRATPTPSLQARVHAWMRACFGDEITSDRVERGDRLAEEVFELLQSGGYDPRRALALLEYVWSRPVGEPDQETGGVMVTLAAYCIAHDLDMDAAAEREVTRIWTKIDAIRAKQAGKPQGSALPQDWPVRDRGPRRRSRLALVASHLAALYLGAGLFGGLLMQQALPAMNLLGVGYYAATWPGHVYCARVDRGCDPIPERLADWMFTPPDGDFR